MTRLHIICGLGLGLSALLTAGCGDDRTEVPFQPEQPAASSAPHLPPRPVTQASDPPAVAGDDPLTTPDQLTAGADGSAKDPGDVPSPGSGDLLGNDLPTPTAYRHWLTVSQFGAQVRLRVNGVAQGGYAASTTTDITMVMRPGANTIAVEYAPKAADAWARVYVTRDPPLPQILLFDSSTLHTPDVPNMKTLNGIEKPKPTTQTYTVIVR